MHHPTNRIIHTTAFVTPVVEHWLEREIAQWVHPMKDRSCAIDAQYFVMSVRFNVHIQSKLLSHTPVMDTYSSYELGCVCLGQ